MSRISRIRSKPLSRTRSSCEEIPDLYRLIYTSEAGAPDGVECGPGLDLDRLASRASTQNTRSGISGVLLCSRGYFLQVLEGAPDEIEATFERICCDTRHSNLSLIDYSPVMKRTFGRWAMAHLKPVAPADTESIEDLILSIKTGLGPSAIVAEVSALAARDDKRAQI